VAAPQVEYADVPLPPLVGQPEAVFPLLYMPPRPPDAEPSELTDAPPLPDDELDVAFDPALPPAEVQVVDENVIEEAFPFVWVTAGENRYP
jgi:hypothetical protein